MASSFAHVAVPSAFGTVRIVWQETEARSEVIRVLLPNERAEVHDVFYLTTPENGSLSCSVIAEFAGQLLRFLRGDAVGFGLELLALERCSDFQRRVLSAVSSIPRGWISTYGGIAGSLGVPGGARAVGGAISRNPFPIVIPCHRAIRSDGHLGGFRGGLKMKQALLELEGVEVTPTGKVLTDRFCFQ